jgi:hypothetical protein
MAMYAARRVCATRLTREVSGVFNVPCALRWDTYQENCVRPFARARHCVQVMVREAVQHGVLVLYALIAAGADGLDGHGSRSAQTHCVC